MWPLVVVIAALLVERLWHERVVSAERRRLLNALMARTPTEFAHLNRIDEVTPPTRDETDERPVEIPWGL